MGFISDTIHSVGESTGLNDVVDSVYNAGSDVVHSVGEATGINDVVDGAYNAASDFVHSIGEATGLDKVADSPAVQAVAAAVATYYGVPMLVDAIGSATAGYFATTAATTEGAIASATAMNTAISAGVPVTTAAAAAGLSWPAIASGVAAVAGVASGTLTGEQQAAAIKAAGKAQIEAAKTAEDRANAAAAAAAAELRGPSKEYLDTLAKTGKETYDANMAAIGANIDIMNKAFADAQTKLDQGFAAIKGSFDKVGVTLVEGRDKARTALTEGYAAGTGAYTKTYGDATKAVSDSYATARGNLSDAQKAAQAKLDEAQEVIDKQREQVKQNRQEMLANNDHVISTVGAQMAKWDAVFGPVLDNLSDFYTNMTAQKISGQRLTIQAQEFNTVKTNLTKSFAQRGINAGTQQALMMQAEMDNARARAQIRAQAPFDVAQAQSNFLTSAGQAAVNPVTGMYANSVLAKNSTIINQQNADLGLTNNEIQLKAAGADLATGGGINMANLATGYGNAMAGLSTGYGSNLANTAIGAGRDIAVVETQYGKNAADIALETARATAQATGDYYNAAADLAVKQGSTLADLNKQKANATSIYQGGLAGAAEAGYNIERDLTGLEYNVAQTGIQNTFAAEQQKATLDAQSKLAAANAQAGILGDVINIGLANKK